ncbi:MAG TPA: 2-dehydropantoate 2-reductase [Gemmatimonadaceae bacterium]|nr:2-dehydropantoate 2-reductase [Gemmatimonadaceae bacterium]
MKICVLGAGAIGAYYGGLLSRAGHDVTLYARRDNLDAILSRGLEIKASEGSSLIEISATDDVDELGAFDFAILGVKSYSLDSIAPVVKRVAGNGATIVPFLNGVETTDRLVGLGVPRQALIGGVTRISVARIAPGVIERRGAFQSVIVGELDGNTSDRTSRIAAAFRDAGVDARASTQIVTDLWEKFVFIASIAASCGLARSAIGLVREAPLGRRLLQRAVQEVVDVAIARRIPLATDEVARVIGAIDALPPGTKPSFLLDVEAGGQTELDVLSGAVSRYAEAAHVSAPVHDTVTAVFSVKR